jgi:hypothetical protein
MDAIQSFKHKGYTVEIHQDEDPLNPRTEFDNLGTMTGFHRNYTIGDKHSFKSPTEVEAHIKATKAVCLPVYLFDHSGLTVRTTPFSCPWDSGQVGYIFIEREKILKEYGAKRLTSALRKKVEEILRSEVETFDQYLTGAVYGYVVKKNDKTEESCWGFFGDIEYVLQEAKDMAEGLAREAAVKHATKVKAYIKNKVPLLARAAVA